MSSIIKTGGNFDSQTVRGIQINTERSSAGGKLLPNLPFGSEPAYTVEISAAGMAAYLKSVRDKKNKAVLQEESKEQAGGGASLAAKTAGQTKSQLDLGALSMTDILGLVARGEITSQQAADELQSRQGRF